MRCPTTSCSTTESEPVALVGGRHVSPEVKSEVVGVFPYLPVGDVVGEALEFVALVG